ncbi:MAG: amidohydrolase [Deltaproteobacteria bacterium]|nr:amidohydrolase [Kofleriaceae bacterium]
MRKSQPDGPLESPIPFHAGSNGELAPRPVTAAERRAEETYRRLVDENARRTGLTRRDFVMSACGSAAALLVINQLAGCKGNRGGARPYDVRPEAALDPGAACAALAGTQFVFDVHTHHVDLVRDWPERNPLAGAMRGDRQGGCGEADRLACWSAEHFVREVFVKSDTSVAALTMFPGLTVDARPLFDREAAATRELVDRLARSPRLVVHGMVSPDLGPGQLDEMQRMKEESKVVAWKVYPQYGGWRLDDPALGFPFLERARELGVRLVCAHKGITFPEVVGPAKFGSPDDMGPAAKAFPDLAFLAYHSGYEPGVVEGPYDPAGGGVDRLVRSVRDAGIGPGGNVYADLGTTWRLLMTKPVEAAHVLGKLLVALGPDNVLWGTDALWHGTPQGQIEAFRAFAIPVALQEAHGYPALTPELKAKILGLNGARVYGVDVAATRCAITADALEQARVEHGAHPEPRTGNVGPRTHAEHMAGIEHELALRAAMVR